MVPSEEFMRYAAQCEHTAGATRDPETKASWNQWPKDGSDALSWPRSTKRLHAAVPGKDDIGSSPNPRLIEAITLNRGSIQRH